MKRGNLVKRENPIRVIGFSSTRRLDPNLVQPGVGRLEHDRQRLIRRIKELVKENKYDNRIIRKARNKLGTDAPFSARVDAFALDIIKTPGELARLIKNLMIIGVNERVVLSALGLTEEYLEEQRKKIAELEEEKKGVDISWTAADKKGDLDQKESLLEDYQGIGIAASDLHSELETTLDIFKHFKVFFNENTYTKWGIKIEDIQNDAYFIGATIDDEWYELAHNLSTERIWEDDIDQADPGMDSVYRFKESGPSWFRAYEDREEKTDEEPTHILFEDISYRINEHPPKLEYVREKREIIQRIKKHFPDARNFSFNPETEMWVLDQFPIYDSYVTFTAGESITEAKQRRKKEHVSLKKFFKYNKIERFTPT